ncbi:hypothetical protein KCU85_g8261, partial [Aureobasidium melanogenum]
MRFTTVILSCFASQMAVQATSFVTIVKTVAAVSSVDVSTPALDHTSFPQLASISRREEVNLTETTSMTRIYLTSPYTTYVDIPLTPLSAGKSKSDASGHAEPTESTKVKSTKVESTSSTASMTRIHLTYPYTTVVDIPLTALPSGYVEPTHKSIKSTNSTVSMTRYHFTSPYTTDVDIPVTAVRTEKSTRPVGFTTSTTSTTSTSTSSTSSSTTSTPPSACDIYPYPAGYCDDSSSTTSSATASSATASSSTKTRW